MLIRCMALEIIGTRGNGVSWWIKAYQEADFDPLQAVQGFEAALVV